MRNRRAWGFIVDISENSSANATTPYLLTAVVRVLYLREGETEFSFAWVRVPTYTPNCIASDDVHIRDGNPIFGILIPTIGDFPNATFATWEVGALPQRLADGIGPSLFTSDGDLDQWSWAPLPSLGASGFFAKKNPPLTTCLRIKPPLLEVREYNSRFPGNVCEPTPPPPSLSLALSRRAYFLNEG